MPSHVNQPSWPWTDWSDKSAACHGIPRDAHRGKWVDPRTLVQMPAIAWEGRTVISDKPFCDTTRGRDAHGPLVHVEPCLEHWRPGCARRPRPIRRPAGDGAAARLPGDRQETVSCSWRNIPCQDTGDVTMNMEEEGHRPNSKISGYTANMAPAMNRREARDPPMMQVRVEHGATSWPTK